MHPTGDYLISAATFPTYFIKDKAAASSMNHELDLGIFAQCFAKPLGISTRFVGDEPFCLVTAGYNRAMLDFLPRHGVSVVVIPRLASDGAAVSASRVRQLLRENNRDAIRRLVPPSTYESLFAQQ